MNSLSILEYIYIYTILINRYPQNTTQLTLSSDLKEMEEVTLNAIQ